MPSPTPSPSRVNTPSSNMQTPTGSFQNTDASPQDVQTPNADQQPNDTVLPNSAALGELNSAEAKSLLDTIDSLRELQIGEIVSLPQIIVVGDQSSGKSSVLEAISRMPFPVRGDLCTRFATELVLRRTPVKSVSVTIHKSNGGTNSPAASGAAKRDRFDESLLPALIEDAKKAMGIHAGSAKSFSRDVLRVEISGPDVYPLTLVDLPGFFHAETSDQSEEGKIIVNQLVESYMKQKNSIILAVVSANNQLANQKVLTEARKHDPSRERTMGVITKPDLARPGSSDERKFLQLAKNLETTHKLSLGWHVLKNRAEDNAGLHADARDEEEERFFRTGAWSQLSPGSRGISTLRRKLGRVLLDHIRKVLPGLIREIETNLQTRQESLKRLGPARNTPEQLRTYLLGITEQFQRLTRDALSGKYTDTFFGDLTDKQPKLRAMLRNYGRAFNITLKSKGASFSVAWNDEDYGVDFVDDSAEDAPDYLADFMQLYDFQEPEVKTEDDLTQEVETFAAINQGIEFPGIPNADLVVQFFRMQIQPWNGIATTHIDLVTTYVKNFVELLLSHIIGTDMTTMAGVLGETVDPFFDEKRGILEAKLAEVLRPYIEGYAPPLDDEFRKVLTDRRLNRLADEMGDLLEDRTIGKDGVVDRDILEGIVKNEFSSQDTSEFGTQHIIDMTAAYYLMCLRTFTENVINLAVESCLVCDIPNILTSQRISAMDEDQLRRLAAESEEVQEERAMLQQQADALRAALYKCRSSRPREMRQTPSSMALTKRRGTPEQKPPADDLSPPASPTPHQGTQLTPAQASAVSASLKSATAPRPATGSLFAQSTPAPSSTSVFAQSIPAPSSASLFAQSIPAPSSASLFPTNTPATATPASGGLFAGVKPKPFFAPEATSLFAPKTGTASPFPPNSIFAPKPEGAPATSTPSSIFSSKPAANNTSGFGAAAPASRLFGSSPSKVETSAAKSAADNTSAFGKLAPTLGGSGSATPKAETPAPKSWSFGPA